MDRTFLRDWTTTLAVEFPVIALPTGYARGILLRMARKRVKRRTTVSRTAVNRDKPDRWKADIAASVDMYNDWFMRFAPKAFRTTRVKTTGDVKLALRTVDNLTRIEPARLRLHPEILPTLRMCTGPPLAVDRVIVLAHVPAGFVKSL